MASNLLKVFQKIEQGRKYQIKKVKDLGYPVADNASFVELANYIGVNTDTYETNYDDKPPCPWTRPEGWPDCKSILRNAPIRVSGVYPGVLMLFKDSEDTISFPTDTHTISVSNQKVLGTCYGLLFSDGTYYTSFANLTHTWDKSKDIIVDKGRFPGVYRWVILYYKTKTDIKDLNLVGFPAIEILIGQIGPKLDKINTSEINANLIGRYDDATLNATNTLVNLEVLEEFTNTSIEFQYNSNGNGILAMNKFDKLEHINFGPIIHMPSSNYSKPFQGNMPRLVDFEAPNIKTSDNYEWGPKAAPLLTRFYFPKFISSKAITIGDGKCFKEVNFPGLNPTFTGGCDVPNNVSLNIGYISSSTVPKYWTTNHCSIAQTAAFCSGWDCLQLFDFHKQTKGVSDTTSVLQATVTYITFPDAVRLNQIILTDDWIYRLDFSNLRLGRDCWISMFNALRDLTLDTTATVTDPIIKIGVNDKSELSEEDLAIATNKGWVIQ